MLNSPIADSLQRVLPFGLVVCAFSLTACSSRIFSESSAKPDSSTLQDSASVLVPGPDVLSDFQGRLETADIIVNDPAFPTKDEPPTDYTIAFARYPGSTFWAAAGPEMYFDSAGAPLSREAFDALRRPQQKEKELSGAQVQLPRVMVAAALERLKKQFYLGGAAKDVNAILGRVRGTPFEKLWIQTPGDLEGGVVTVAPNHWSDVVTHFYAATPVLTHACWSLASRRFAEAPVLAGKPFAPRETRAKVLAFCLGEEEPTAKELEDSELAQAAQTRKFFQALYGTLWAQDQASGRRVNVFRYIMLSHAYAFPIGDQQDVLETFYRGFDGITMVRSESFPVPTDSQSSCAPLRPLRFLDPTDGTHCLGEKVLLQPLAGNGR